MTNPGFGSGSATDRSLQKLVQMGVFRPHLGPAYGIHHGGGGLRRPMCAAAGRDQPVVVVGRHQHELAATVAGDFNRLAARLVLELAEPALKFSCRYLSHMPHTQKKTDYLYYTHNLGESNNGPLKGGRSPRSDLGHNLACLQESLRRSPLQWIAMPVTTGAMIPAILPTVSCIPIHWRTALGAVMDCEVDHTSGAKRPWNISLK